MKKLLLAGCAAVLFLSSCKKETDDHHHTDTPATAEKQLKKLTRVESGVTTVFNLTYDNSKRLTAMTSTDNKEFFSFTYDGNGNCTQMIQREDDVKNIYTYAYTNNVPVSGTFKNYDISNGQEILNESDVLTYTVQNGKVTSIHANFLLGGQQSDFPLSYTGDNCTKIEATSPIAYKAEFTYGTKKPIFPKVFKYVMDQAGLSLQFFASNDVTKISFDFPGTALDHVEQSTYTYDSDGYVLTGTSAGTSLTFQY